MRKLFLPALLAASPTADKDAKKYPQTGGWGFEAWRADNRKDRIVGKDAAAQCFGCHAQQQKTDFVFSKYRL